MGFLEQLRAHRKGRRIDRHRLHDEIELPERGRRRLWLQDVIFEEEGHIVQELDRDLAIGAEHRAVDEDSLARPQ